jgi:hypothetical protein
MSHTSFTSIALFLVRDIPPCTCCHLRSRAMQVLKGKKVDIVLLVFVAKTEMCWEDGTSSFQTRRNGLGDDLESRALRFSYSPYSFCHASTFPDTRIYHVPSNKQRSFSKVFGATYASLFSWKQTTRTYFSASQLIDQNSRLTITCRAKGSG